MLPMTANLRKIPRNLVNLGLPVFVSVDERRPETPQVGAGADEQSDDHQHALEVEEGTLSQEGLPSGCSINYCAGGVVLIGATHGTG